MTTTTLNLYRSLLRQAHSMKDYNFRSYAMRRVKVGFKKSSHLQGEEAAAAIKEGEKQLAMLQRQAALSGMYPSAKSVME